ELLDRLVLGPDLGGFEGDAAGHLADDGDLTGAGDELALVVEAGGEHGVEAGDHEGGETEEEEGVEDGEAEADRSGPVGHAVGDADEMAGWPRKRFGIGAGSSSLGSRRVGDRSGGRPGSAGRGLGVAG